MARTHLEETSDVVIYGEDGGLPGALATIRPRASALRAVCQRDIARLAGMFGAQGRFGGAGNKLQVVLDPTLTMFGGNALATNQGFAVGGQTTIEIASAGNVLINHPVGELDDAIAAAFCAEFAEVLLSLRTHDGQPTLDPGQADGEGFSRVMAAFTHPLGYYAVLGRTITNWATSLAYPAVLWMNEPGPNRRRNYLGTDAYGDGEPVANGCAILFLHYLHSQLGFSWQAIVNSLGKTLPETFTNLTGRGTGFEEMLALLNRVFPPAGDVNWDFENPYPIGDSRRWRVDFSTPEGDASSNDPVFATSVLAEGDVDIRPGPLCPVGRYHYELDLTHSPAMLSATATGFGQPVFEWNVADSDASDTPVPFFAVGWSDDPLAAPGTRPEHQVQTTLSFSVASSWQTWQQPASSTLSVWCADNPPAIPGHFTIPVTLTVHDLALPDPPLVWNTWTGIDLERLIWDPTYERDRDECARKWRELLVKFERYREVIILRTLPDPPPDFNRAIELVSAVRRELETLRSADPETAARAEEALHSMGWLPRAK